MKAAILAIILTQILSASRPDGKDELTLLSGKIEFRLREKGWRLDEKLNHWNFLFHRWRGGSQYAKLSFFYVKTVSEAVERFREDVEAIRAEFGPEKVTRGIGEEACEWEGVKDNQSLLYVRKQRFVIALAGPSTLVLEDLAKEILTLLPRTAEVTVLRKARPVIEQLSVAAVECASLVGRRAQVSRKARDVR